MDNTLIEHLVQRGVASRREVRRCVLRASMSKNTVVEEITRHIDVEPQVLVEAMADYWGIDVWENTPLTPRKEDLLLVGVEGAESFGVLPVSSDDEGAITLLLYDVDKAQPHIEKIRRATGHEPTLVLGPRDLVEAEVRRLYGRQGSQEPPTGPLDPQDLASLVPSRGVVRPRRSSLDSPHESAAPRTIEAEVPVEEALPTRQVDLTVDNPFMDLVQESARTQQKPALTDEAKAPQADFFGGFDDVDEKTSATPEGTFEADNFEEALQAFNAELEVEEPEPQRPPGFHRASVDWGDADDAPAASRTPSSSGSRFLGSNDSSGNFPVEGSGLFPVDRHPGGLLDLGSEGSEQELTLADVVHRQRRIIQRMEREIEYQKGILQTMAEMLIEARVLSRRKLKKRLRALKKEQQSR